MQNITVLMYIGLLSQETATKINFLSEQGYNLQGLINSALQVSNSTLETNEDYCLAYWKYQNVSSTVSH